MSDSTTNPAHLESLVVDRSRLELLVARHNVMASQIFELAQFIDDCVHAKDARHADVCDLAYSIVSAEPETVQAQDLVPSQGRTDELESCAQERRREIALEAASRLYAGQGTDHTTKGSARVVSAARAFESYLRAGE